MKAILGLLRLIPYKQIGSLNAMKQNQLILYVANNTF